MSKKVKTILIALAIIAAILLIWFGISKSSIYKKVKANIIFGDTYCGGHSGTYSYDEVFETPTNEKIKCKICGKKINKEYTSLQTICRDCADKTNRCPICGSLLK